MKRLEFMFEVPHPDDLTIIFRFVIDIAYVDPADLPPGTIIETHARALDGGHV